MRGPSRLDDRARDVASEVRNISINGTPGFVRVSGYVAHQRTRRQVHVFLQPETILELAAAIVKCPRVRKDGKYEQIGHAIWHYENPDAPPCLDPKGEDEQQRAAAKLAQEILAANPVDISK
jgi:hypothetical protein